MFTILDYSSALEYSIIRRYTNIVYYYKYCILLLWTRTMYLHISRGLVTLTTMEMFAWILELFWISINNVIFFSLII